MTDTTSKLTEFANPAAVGWRWSNTYEGFEGAYEHEVVWVRGTHTLTYGTKAPFAARWVTTPIVNPERFGFDGTLKGARKAAQAFVTDAS